jgi:hypothetical protein
MSKFIEQFMEYTKEYESPGSFWKWSCYAAIGAVLRDNCYRTTGDNKLFPSTYILLMAESGTHRKGRPVEMCTKLVSAIANTKVISGRASIQAILDELSRTETNAKTGKLVKGGSAIFFAPELSAGIVEDPQAIKILTDIYDCRPDYHSMLKSGRNHIDNMVFSMFAASNAALLKDTYNTTAIQGGLLARTFMVCPNEFRPSNALLDMKDTDKEFKLLVAELRVISELNGEYEFTDDAKIEYVGWYKPFRESYKNKVDKAGIVSRIHTGILKIAMILAAGDLSLVVKKCHIEESIEICLSLIPNYGAFIMGNGKGKLSEAGAIVLGDLMDAKDNILARKDILRKHWSDFDSALLDELITTFEQSGLVKTHAMGNTICYKMTDSCKEMMTKPGEK